MALETSPERPAPVRQIATLLTGWIDRLGAVWVEGQIAQLNRRQGMATVFLVLRDPLGDISMSVTCQRQVIDAADPPVVEGASVVVHGRPRYYTNRGTLSLVADDIRMVGLGELLARLERRRQLLAAEGLFARERKHPLPFLPHRIGLVTARGSAAERDVLENARRRWPAVAFETRYAAMQGPSCAREVMAAVEWLDRQPGVDVVVVARGGGSIEDLLPFSDEGLVRVVATARTPVVSAIGHDQDTPLLDLVADVRASTPTDAAKLLVPEVGEELERVSELRRRARRHVTTLVAHERAQLAALRARPVLSAPVTVLEQRSAEVDELAGRARRALGHRLDRAADDLDHARARARSLSPRETLRRGYAVVQDDGGRVVTSTAQTARGAHVTARLFTGHLALTVDGVRPDAAEAGGPSTGSSAPHDAAPHDRAAAQPASAHDPTDSEDRP